MGMHVDDQRVFDWLEAHADKYPELRGGFARGTAGVYEEVLLQLTTIIDGLELRPEIDEEEYGWVGINLASDSVFWSLGEPGPDPEGDRGGVRPATMYEKWLFQYVVGPVLAPTPPFVEGQLIGETEHGDRVFFHSAPGFGEVARGAVAKEAPTHRHAKRGTGYVLIGFGKMQAEKWLAETSYGYVSADMRDIAVYRSVDDNSLWARPREEFEDGRFIDLRAAKA